MIKRNLAIGASLLIAACAAGDGGEAQFAAPEPAQWDPQADALSLMALSALCGADAGADKVYAPDIALIEGMGTGGFAVDSQVKAAQDWFDYGLALSHAFYHEDAKAAMREAVASDPACAMCAWGLAWSLGPTLNYGIDEDERAEALAQAEQALALVRPGDAKARALAEAMIARYQPSEEFTEPAFGRAMAKIATDYEDDADLAVLAAHSLLIPVRGGDRSGLRPALGILEDVLAERPNDTGAIHYYIHGTEFDGRAEDALPYAHRLGELAPMASHLVHMPAHTFFQAGLYHEAGVVNARAIEADYKWLEAGGDPTGIAPGYYAHNLSFGMAGALMSGDADLALKYAEHAALVAGEGEAARSRVTVTPRTWVALGLYAPEQALALPAPTAAMGARGAIYHAYARGEALVRSGDLAGARAELEKLAPDDGESAERRVARGVLAGRIAMAQGKPLEATAHFREAASVQDAQLSSFRDPPTWWYPVRRSLAAAYLEAGDFRRARREAQESLQSWKHDPLALWVLSEAERRLGDNRQAREHQSQAWAGWRGGREGFDPRWI